MGSLMLQSQKGGKRAVEKVKRSKEEQLQDAAGLAGQREECNQCPGAGVTKQESQLPEGTPGGSWTRGGEMPLPTAKKQGEIPWLLSSSHLRTPTMASHWLNLIGSQ